MLTDMSDDVCELLSSFSDAIHNHDDVCGLLSTQ